MCVLYYIYMAKFLQIGLKNNNKGIILQISGQNKMTLEIQWTGGKRMLESSEW